MNTMESTFIWIDLSTFDVAQASDFYQNVLGWEIPQDEDTYLNCRLDGSACGGIYEMPPFFQKIRMPSFWMTYIAVTDINAIVARAKELGGKIEVEEQDGQGRVALIRDPSGAGFTCYEGSERAASRDFRKTGSWCWSELWVSDVDRIRTFYTSLFGWTIQAESEAGRYAIHTVSGKYIGAIQEASEDVKGSKEFWAVYFASEPIQGVQARIEQSGGTVEGIYPHPFGRQLLAYDSQGAAFFMLERSEETHPATATSPTSGRASSLPWRSLAGLLGIYLIVLFEQAWGWGILFLFWVLPDLKSGTTYFIEPLHRRSNPFLYWAVVLTWLGMSLYMLIDWSR